jgi:hypothetical protein
MRRLSEQDSTHAQGSTDGGSSAHACGGCDCLTDRGRQVSTAGVRTGAELRCCSILSARRRATTNVSRPTRTRTHARDRTRPRVLFVHTYLRKSLPTMTSGMSCAPQTQLPQPLGPRGFFFFHGPCWRASAGCSRCWPAHRAPTPAVCRQHAAEVRWPLLRLRPRWCFAGQAHPVKIKAKCGRGRQERPRL